MKADNDNTLHFLSVCAGIEAVSVAWHPLGWRAGLLSEIEKFPRLVLAHHYPTTRQWGDFTALRIRHLRRLGIPLPGILVGGTPCQAFSVAGLRRSLADARGNLTLSFVRLAHALANTGSLRNVVWENVPGVLSTKDNAFGCFLGALVGADDALLPSERPRRGRSTAVWRWVEAGRWPVLDDNGEETGEFVDRPEGHVARWPRAGMVAGPLSRAAWRVLDAQYFGLAQRRRRVFVVADFGNGADPAAVLFEPVGVLGNSPPSREAQKDVAAAVTASTGGVSGKDDIDGRVTAVLRGISDYGDGLPVLRAKGGDCAGGSEAFVFAPEIARCVSTREGNSQDYETTTMVAKCVTGDVTHTLRAEGFDASEDGTGRGNPIVAFNPRATDVPVTGDITGALDASFPGPAICFSAKDYGGDAMTELAPTLRAGGHAGSHANAGVMPAIAFQSVDFGADATVELSPTIRRHDPMAVNVQSAVRRLTPRECERLQGFPDDYTLLPGYDADGPRYKALGNSMAVPVMAWIGERIARFLPTNDNAAARHAA